MAFLLVVVILAKGQGNTGLRDAALLSGCLWILIRLPVIGIWPLPALGAVVAVVLLRGPRSTTLRWRRWLRVGSISRGDWLLCGVIVVFTAAALVTWQRWTGGALPATYGALLESVPRPAGIVGIFLFLVVNGLVEDSVWSGVLMTASTGPLPAPLAVLTTAASFGLAHLHGVPDGPIGVAMVVVWGVVLAVLRLRTRGMLATYAAHILADATIVALLVPSVLQSK
jgi:membrane protease YdiL (CAAX protease family)